MIYKALFIVTKTTLTKYLFWMMECIIVCNFERLITIGTSLGKFDNANIIHSDVSYVLMFLYHYV